MHSPPSQITRHTSGPTGQGHTTILVVGPSRFLLFWFQQDFIRIGRSPDNDIPLHSPTVSWLHARISTTHGGLSLEDLGSTNGTHGNGQPVHGRVRLSPHDQIKIGPNVLSFVDEYSDLVDLLIRAAPAPWHGAPRRPPLSGATQHAPSRTLPHQKPMDRSPPDGPHERSIPPGASDDRSHDRSNDRSHDRPQPTAASLRRVIDLMLPDAPDLDAFVFDHFRGVHRQFHDSMGRTAKVTLLLQRVRACSIVCSLARHDADLFREFESLLTYEWE